MSTDIYAYTEPHNDYPAFVNLSQKPSGLFALTVRSQGDAGRNVATIILAREQLMDLVNDASRVARADEPKARAIDTSDAAIEREIVAKGLTAPRVTPADIEANIDSEHYFTAAQGVYGASADEMLRRAGEDATLRGIGIVHAQPLRLLTFCVLVLRNDFTVTGESACASPENFDAEIGRKIARENAINKVWPLMGYALKQRLHDAASAAQQLAPGAAHAGYSTMQPHQQRVVNEKAELDERLAKLVAFTKSPFFSGLDSAERNRLDQQAATMAMYSDILGDRIAAFAPA